MAPRQLQQAQTNFRNVPMRPRAWRELLERPDTLVAESDEGEVALVPRDGQLYCYWAFEDLEGMRVAFPGLWEQLRPEVAQSGADYVVMDLVALQNRDWLAPLLRDADFELFAEWMEMVHPGLDPDAVPEFPEGVEMRKATDADLDAVRRIWLDAYGDLAPGPRTIEATFEQATWIGVLTRDGEVVAFAVNGPVQDASGRVLVSAVDPEARDEGYGTLVLQAAAFQLTTQDAREATLLVRPDLPNALRTAAAAGFRPGQGGIEYHRTTDEEAIARAREERRVAGVKARFGKWR